MKVTLTDACQIMPNTQTSYFTIIKGKITDTDLSRAKPSADTKSKKSSPSLRSKF